MRITAGIAAVVGVTLVGIIACMTVIVVTGHDVTIFVVAIGLLFTSATGFIALFLNQKKQGEEIATVKANTNGTLTKLHNQNEALTARLLLAIAKHDPDEATQLLESTLDRQTVDRIREGVIE